MLFENKNAGIGLPAINFEDYLGKGFSGDINGHRTRIAKFQIAQFDFYNPIIAFPDSASTKNVTMLTGRVGSVGGEILKRFAVILDYQNQMMFLKKGNNYGAKFGYNMSGIELQNEGVQWVTETVPLETVMEDNTFGSDGEKVKKFKYKFSLKPVYTVSNIRKNSPAELAGLAKGDIVVSINYVIGYKYSLEEINELLKSDDGKWLNLEVERNGKSLRFKFQLKDML